MDAVDPELLTRLLDEHGAALVLYAQQWCDTPEDVVQEAFLRLMREREPPGNVVGWLYRVVRNGAISASRAAGRRRRREAAVAHRREPWFKPSEADGLDAAEMTRAGLAVTGAEPATGSPVLSLCLKCRRWRHARFTGLSAKQY